MAFNKRIVQKLEKACEGNDAMAGYMHDLVVYEMRETKHYTKDYEEYLKKRAKEEALQEVDAR